MPEAAPRSGRGRRRCSGGRRGDTRDITGNAAAPRIAWVREHEPRLFDAVRTVLPQKDYVRLCMTGDRATDLSDAAGTQWLDVERRRWSDAMLAACGLTPTHMPVLREGSDVTGHLRASVASAWGMPAVLVAGGGSDMAAGAVGSGAVGDGDAILSLGASGLIFVATAAFRAGTAGVVRAFCHAVPDMWHQVTAHLPAGSCIDWAARAIGADGTHQLLGRAEAAGVASGPELFLPYASDDRTSQADPAAWGAFLHLDRDTDAGRLSQAVLEGVAFALAEGLAALRDTGMKVDRLSVIGGCERSAAWARTLASALEVDLFYRAGGEAGPALGAARLAQLAVDGGQIADTCPAPPVMWVQRPEPALIDALAEKKRRFAAARRRIAFEGTCQGVR